MTLAYTEFWNLLTSGLLNLQNPSASYRLWMVSNQYEFAASNSLVDITTVAFSNTVALESFEATPTGFTFSFSRAIWGIVGGFTEVNAVVLTFVDSDQVEHAIIYAPIAPDVSDDSLRITLDNFITLGLCG